MLDFGRDICSNLPLAERLEWLVSNGIGEETCHSELKVVS
jgi:hypothetical protein